MDNYQKIYANFLQRISGIQFELEELKKDTFALIAEIDPDKNYEDERALKKYKKI